MLLIQIADIHIKNNVRHEEYKEVFKNLNKKLLEINEEKIIVICGDITDHHGNMNAESIKIFKNFIIGLSSYGKIIIISGNHDKPVSHLKATTTIESLLINLRTENEIYNLTKENRCIKIKNINFVLTDMDEMPYVLLNKNNSEIYIGLYHGTLYKSKSESYEFTDESKIKCSDFINYDYVLLGDIHKMQYMNKQETIAYSGSLIQQNFGESIDKHGIIVWDLLNKTSYFEEINNEYCYANAILQNNELKIENEDILKKLNKKKIHLKLHYDENMYEELNKHIKELKKIYDIQSIIKTQNVEKFKEEIKNININQNIVEIYKELSEINKEKEDEEVIEELKKKELEMQILQENKCVKIKKLRFKNALSYSNDLWYEIDFELCNGIITITGINGIGKSSIIDILLCAIYSKFERSSHMGEICCVNSKNDTVIELHATINEVSYIILRTIQFKDEKLRSSVSITKMQNGEANILSFTNKTTAENYIKDIFGDYETFTSLCISMQDGQRLLNLSDKAKYELLADLLNIKKYENMYSFYSKNVKNNKKQLNILNEKLMSYDLEIKKEGDFLIKQKEYIENKKIILQKMDELKSENVLLQSEIKNIDIEKIYQEIKKYENYTFASNNEKLIKLNKELKNLQEDYTDEYDYLKNLDIENLKLKKINIEKNIKKLNSEINGINNDTHIDNELCHEKEKRELIIENIRIEKSKLENMQQNISVFKMDDIENLQNMLEFGTRCKCCKWRYILQHFLMSFV